MNNIEIAYNLYKLSKDKKDIDLVKLILKTVLLCKDSSIEDVISAYEKIKKGDIKIAEVCSKVEIDEKQKKEIMKIIEKNSKEKIDYVFFSLSDEISGGFKIIIGDNQIDKSFEAQLKKIKITN